MAAGFVLFCFESFNKINTQANDQLSEYQTIHI